jgi:predicted DNA-binding protein
MTQNEWNKLIAGRVSADTSTGIADTIGPDLAEEKAIRLAKATEEKLKKLNNRYQTDTLKAMYDADTVNTENLGYSREVDPYGNRYDAVETKHGDNGYDMQGRDGNWFTNLFHSGPSKSTYSMEKQREQVAGIFNKPVEAVTEQDMLDVANQQQIQKLADLARTEGEDRWIAPLIKDSEQVNLAPTDESGKLIPLNVPIMSQDMGEIGQRGGAALANLANEEVSAQAALDPMQNAFAEEANMSELEKFEDKYTNKFNENKSYWDQIKDLPKAVAAGFGKSVYDAADVYTELGGDISGRAVGLIDEETGRAIDKKVDLGTDEEKTKKINELVEYDNRFTAKNMEKVSKLYDEAMEEVELFSPSTWFNIKGDKLVDAAKTAFADIETAGYSLGYMGPALFGATGKAGVKIAGGAIKEHTDMVTDNLKRVADGTITKEAAKKAANESLKTMSKKDRTKLFLVNNADALQYGAMMNNNQLDEYIENNGGEDATILRSILGTAANAAGMKLDIGVMNSILKPSKGSAEVVGEWLRGAGENKARALLGKVGELTVKAGAAGLREMPQEWGQTFIEEFNKIYGTKKEDGTEVGISEAAAKSRDEAGVGSLMGLAGGVQTSVGVQGTKDAISAVPDAVKAGKRGIELATETEGQKELREAAEYSEPIRTSAIEDMLNGNAEESAKKIEEVHGKMSYIVDSSASKRDTYKAIVEQALGTAASKGDPELIKNVYKAMAELDKADNEFKMEDVVDDMVYKLTNDFIRLANSTTDDSETKMAELQGKATEGLENNKKFREETLAELIQMQESIKANRELLKSVRGSQDIKGSDDKLKSIEDKIKDLLDGKSIDAVNEEILESGFMEYDVVNGKPKANPNKPGINKYKRELKDLLLNTRLGKDGVPINEKLLDKSVVKTANITLPGLTKFAKSRYDKLYPKGKRKYAFQTEGLMKQLKTENEQMLSTITELLTTTKNLQNVNKAIKESYVAELEQAGKSALEASNEIDSRLKLLKEAKKPEYGTPVTYVENGEVTTKVLKYEDDKPVFSEIDKQTPQEPVVTDEVKQEIAELKEKGESADDVKIKFDLDDSRTPETRAKIAEYVEGYYSKDPVSEGTSEYKTAKETEVKQAKVGMEAEPKAMPDTVLGETRKIIDGIGGTLKEATDKVNDMNLKAAVKNYYTGELAKISEKQSILRKGIDKLEKAIESNNKSANKLINSMRKLALEILANIDQMMVRLEKAKAVNKKLKQQKQKLVKQMNRVLDSIDNIETAYKVQYGVPKKTTEKRSIGEVTKYKDSVYGPMAELGDKRVAAPRQVNKKGKLEAQSTALNRAVEELTNEKMIELRDELKTMPKGKTSLGAKLLERLLINFPINNPIHKIVKRGNDSVFGQLTGNTFANANRLLEVLPKTFKEFFITDAESKQELLDIFKTMEKYLDNTEIGDILIADNARINGSTDGKKHIDYYGVIMKNREKDGETHNFPVEILELIGTTKNGKLQIDEQTKNILKFYSAKMLSDTQPMIGKILSFDESEMAQYLGITDPDEQIRVKNEAAQGYVNSASIRKDIGGEVYQALGIRLNETTPEFTEESFKVALGVLVQAIATENGSMSGKPIKAGGKNQNLIKTNWKNIGVDRDALTKAINKLQYLNENRSRPLPITNEPADKNDRVVMNTRNPMDKKSTDFLNKQEKIAYSISPRLQRWLEMDETEALKAMGYVDIESSGLHVSEKYAQMARNDKLVREWEILKTFAKATKNKEFYLNWGQTVSGRYTIMNNINYQESKLHREFVVAEGSTELVDVNDADSRQMLEASVMQGLDMDPDKLSAETATKNFNKLFKVTDEGIEVTEEGSIKTAYEALRKGEIDAEAMGEVFADSEGHHGISSIELLVDWDTAIKTGEKLETHANLEIDAITSGMILTLLQIGSDQAIRLAEKGGIYTKQRKVELEKYVKQWLGKKVNFTPGALIEAGSKHASAIENGTDLELLKGQETDLNNDAVFKDLYSTIGVAMIGEVQAYQEKLEKLAEPSENEVKQLAMLNEIGELNLKNIRSIAKSPVMVYIYGATISSIKKKLTYSLGVDTLVKTIKKASKLLKEGKSAKDELTFVNMMVPNKKYVDDFGVELKEKMPAWKKLLQLDISAEVVDDINDIINATFGTAIETAFESRLGFVDKNRDAAKSVEMLVFEAYQVRLADEVEKLLDSKYGEGRHKGERYKLSKADLQLINQRLTEQGYGHNIVWDEDSGRVNQSLNKTGQKGGKYSSSVQVGDTKVGGQIKEFKPMVNTGAAPTISIHAIDGRMMLDVFNSNGMNGGNVYDAVVLGINKGLLTQTADAYNTNMIETGFSRSVLADQLGMLENMLSTMNDIQEKQMFSKIGMRPKGELAEDYTNEANRLGLGIGKMLERIELAEQINQERLANSGKGYYSGHLFQMGSGVVEINEADTRAKRFPQIDAVKTRLKNKLEQDRKVTQQEFDGKLDNRTNYVFNLDDIANKVTQVKSAANVVQIALKPDGKKLKVTDKQWESLSKNDTVEIIGKYQVPEKQNSQSRHYHNILKGVLKSDANVVTQMDLSESGRELIDGVWVKQIKDEGKAPVQENVDTILLEEVNKLVAKGLIPNSAKNKLIKDGKLMISNMNPEDKLDVNNIQESLVKLAAKIAGNDPEQAVVEHRIVEEHDEKLSKEYTNMFKSINKEFINASVSIGKEFLLDKIIEDVNEFVPGGYKPQKHSVNIVNKDASRLELELATSLGYDVKQLGKLKETYPAEVVEEVAKSVEYQKLKKEHLEKRVTELEKQVENMDINHTLVHELVHAAEYLFMEKKNKTAKEQAVANRLELLFEEVKKRKGYKEYTTDSPYWTKDVHEFVAEALSNPRFIRELDAMPTYNKYNKLSTVLRAIVDALVSIVSTKNNKESVYAYVLDGLIALIEVDKKVAGKMTANEIINQALECK